MKLENIGGEKARHCEGLGWVLKISVIIPCKCVCWIKEDGNRSTMTVLEQLLGRHCLPKEMTGCITCSAVYSKTIRFRSVTLMDRAVWRRFWSHVKANTPRCLGLCRGPVYLNCSGTSMRSCSCSCAAEKTGAYVSALPNLNTCFIRCFAGRDGMECMHGVSWTGSIQKLLPGHVCYINLRVVFELISTRQQM